MLRFVGARRRFASVHVQMLHAPPVTLWCCLVIIPSVGLPGTQYLRMCVVLRMDPKSVTQYGRPLGKGETRHCGETGARNVQVKGQEDGLVRKEKTFMEMVEVWIQLRTRHLRARGTLRTPHRRSAQVCSPPPLSSLPLALPPPLRVFLCLCLCRCLSLFLSLCLCLTVVNHRTVPRDDTD